MVLADETSPVFLGGAFETIASCYTDHEAFVRAFTTGEGIGWGDHDDRLYTGALRLFRPGYEANLVQSWLPALDGVVEKLQRRRERGRRRLRPRCLDDHPGQGVRALVVRRLRHPRALDRGGPRRGRRGRRRATDPLRGRRPRRTSRAPATTWSACSTACTTWATRSARPAGSASRCADDGTLLLVEPAAGERLEDNLNPVSRLYYGLSTVICTPSSLAQEVGLGLGAQAGPKRLEEVLHEAGFSHVRVATQTPFNLIIEARA